MAFSFTDMSALLKQVEQHLKTENHFLYEFYTNELSTQKRFIADMLRLFSECKLMNTINADAGGSLLTPEVTLHEILWYVYLLPWDNTSISGVPNYMEDDKYEIFHYDKIRRRKSYQLSQIELRDDGDVYCGKININQYARKNLKTINSVSDTPQTEDDIVRSIQTKILTKWSVVDKKTNLYGEPLLSFPLVSELSISMKKTYFLLDLGCYVFQKLLELNQDGDNPLIIPKGILESQIIGLTKTSVEPDVSFNEEAEQIEIHSQKYHTIFDVISLATELSSNTDEDPDVIIQDVICEIKKENRTFANVTTRDFVGLSNIIKMFFYSGKDTNVKVMTLGEMTDVVLDGISNTYLKLHRKEAICDALDIMHKWASYSFELGASGRITPFNYVAGQYTSPSALAKAIQSGKVDFLPENNTDDKGMTSIVTYPTSDSFGIGNLEQVPVKLEMSNIFRESIEHDQMSRQFSSTYAMIDNANTKALYSYIEMQRKKNNYPDKMYLTYKELSLNFVVERKARFLKTVESCLCELKDIGVILDFKAASPASFYLLEFEQIL